MPGISNIITYVFLFASLNFEVFLLITYFENRLDIKAEENMVSEGIIDYPSVTIIVPCWNEEYTVSKTIFSLLDLNYPKDKLKITIIDDGSTDNTWQKIQEFKNHPQIDIHTKVNGGKHTALNYGISKLTTDLVGCLDADSYVDKEALMQIVPYFKDKETMAVAPSVKLWEPKGPLQLLQKVEYGIGIFTRKMFHYMQAVYITPGPFSIFRREVFEKLGGYEHAHNTEDIEIALRMQKNGYKIVHAHNAVVYTVAPSTMKKLLKQRIRWSYGFIQNASDYREIFFNKKYGNLGMMVLPMAGISIISIISLSAIMVYNLLHFAFNLYQKIQTVGFTFHFTKFSFDWFYINTEILAIIGVVATLGTITMILISKKMSEGKLRFGMDLIYFLTLYMFIAPLWIGKAAYNAVFKVKASWR
ncbi:glycosyltransferase family 2 protein [Patescibacteria group bacterium]|nr:glycosyltransferase family 2 protein [Patescibacteria group bacterium]